jgi:DNA invertase Pin-like site-specific DNA recombinase
MAARIPACRPDNVVTASYDQLHVNDRFVETSGGLKHMNERTTTVVGYARVSTAEQGERGAGLDAQRRAIMLECDRRGWTLARIEHDVASGKSRKRRPGLDSAIAAVATGEVTALVVAKLDRLSRNTSDALDIAEQFIENRWGLRLLDLDADTTTATGLFQFTMQAAMARFERDRIAERTKEALAIKRSQGVQLGRPLTLPDKVRRRIVRERSNGRTWQQIADRLTAAGVPTAHGGTWRPGTVQRIATPKRVTA